MPSRHSKNSTDSSVFSYHEKRKAGHGSQTQRYGADSQIPFGYCCLTLQPASDPVATPSGHIYSREAILEYIIAGKKRLKRELREWEQQNAEELEREAAAAEAKDDEALRRFAAANVEVDGGYSAAQAKTVDGPGARERALRHLNKAVDHESVADKKQDIKRTSFWVPEFTPTAEARVARPETRPRSPMSNRPLRAKELVPVQLEAQEGTGYGHGDGRTRYLCSVSRKQIGAQPCVLLKNTGAMLLESVYNDLVRPTMLCPTTGKKLKSKDVIKLKRSGSSFAAAGQVEVTKLGLALG
uniref:Nitric oxide synthase-interacting protein zinc-finger domain-containing protein n=1 Tax=Phaeomonas parva TaxID=124430 RepID=A0A7S1TU86_9STRA|eukprot:CAMPEP_0118859944 /NCGR_PEP_ID=MMETSP1163-20130328/5977_1 /TAXON_ID=124430 /ORGANISM="Phaeomonas parva, Strain CCMP2877" /LENGTH=297 /DNA_ID=CAMNT_0006793585 /DNA_START=95 /DNA_END=988 /DNA_ORIENTATION=-